MGWKPGKWKLNFGGNKDRWLVILAIGLIFLILAFPTGGKSKDTGSLDSYGSGTGIFWEKEDNQEAVQSQERKSMWEQASTVVEGTGKNEDSTEKSKAGTDGTEEEVWEAGAQVAQTYEQQLESRLKELLSHMEGVGEVDVMIVLKSSEERVWRVDRNSSYSSTKETDSNGGTRDIQSQDMSEETILTGQGGSEGPLLEKELRPEISGVVVIAEGGGSPGVQAEISAAVEALFGIPPHKIKVLKRAE